MTETGGAADPDRAPGLAALVPKPAAERAERELSALGVYDDSRGIESYDDERVALPVVGEVPADREGTVAAVAAVEEVVAYDLPSRDSTLADRLRARGFTEAEIDAVPGSWAVIGTVVLADFEGCPRPGEVGDALLELHGEADTVLDRGGIAGRTRDPDVTVVAGVGDTETVHTEYGTRYALDLATTMFSPGNKAERARMGDVTGPEERVFDMFAGVGYFALPMARAGAAVTAAELDPTTYQYLVENAVLNDVTDRFRAVRADCADVELEPVDRVVMGHYDAYERLPAGVAALREGGTIHLHEATPEAELPDRPVGRLETAVADAGRSCEVLAVREVKSYAEGVQHVVVDARIE
ncbi:class I SAM-dependent methyltransferase [Haloglomus halophilum]|uniref:class I SAM-dependent methyltransferase n=1 Tax=Haloglomus halophilum TaxID=2962672 RepID=UPI0020C97F44|nr:class I SAM-dependent methyltransferase family protein [Haloglomus halophilum]